MTDPSAEHAIDVPSLTDSPIVALCSCGWRYSSSLDQLTAALMAGIAVEQHAPGFKLDEG